MKTSMWWLVAFYGIYTAGELYFSPIGLALVTKVAPRRIVSMMMGFWLLSYAVGSFVAGWLGSYWQKMSMSSFFLLSWPPFPDRRRHRRAVAISQPLAFLADYRIKVMARSRSIDAGRRLATRLSNDSR